MRICIALLVGACVVAIGEVRAGVVAVGTEYPNSINFGARTQSPAKALELAKRQLPASGITQYLITTRAETDVPPLLEILNKLSIRTAVRSSNVILVETADSIALLTAIQSDARVSFIQSGSEFGQAPIGEPITVPFNLNTQLTHRVPDLRGRYNLSGNGVAVAVFDKGPVMATHVEFTGRVQIHDNGSPTDHATHVAGTIGAHGVQPKAQGMAPDVKIISYTWEDDITKIETALNSGEPRFQITNHSYGPLRGWGHSISQNAWIWYGNPADSEDEDTGFGKYDTYSRDLDEIAQRNLTVFVSAGNNRDTRNDPNAIPGWDGRHYVAQLHQYVTYRRPANFQHSGYDTLNAYAVAKNVITVGAIRDMPLGGLAPTDIVVTPFSSWGPADDGRIKPDVVANGAAVYSPSVELLGQRYNTQAYALKSGTSQASPAAAGIAALLNELSLKKNGRILQPDEMKAILIHTAVSPSVGPNYQIGWGAIDANSAGEIIASEKGMLRTGTVKTGGEGAINVKPSGGPIRITLCWIDPPAPPNDGGLNDRTPTLINDLDVAVTDKHGRRYYPWSLNPNQPGAPATRTGPNTADNVERIDIGPNDIQSEWFRIEVIGPNQAQGQPFALVISGLEMMP